MSDDEKQSEPLGPCELSKLAADATEACAKIHGESSADAMIHAENACKVSGADAAEHHRKAAAEHDIIGSTFPYGRGELAKAHLKAAEAHRAAQAAHEVSGG
jgi:hypothetical protein